MSVRMRLKRMERTRREEAKSAPKREVNEEDWLEFFTALADQGAFDHEPDFPKALALLQQAVDEAIERDDPPFFPPDDFEPQMPRSVRIHWWRLRHHFHYPGVTEALFWLFEMAQRTSDGTPPVTEVEFAELASWFEANLARVRDLEEQSFPIVIDGEKTPDRTNIRYGLTWKGPRAIGAGEVAQHVRRLRTALGDGE